MKSIFSGLEWCQLSVNNTKHLLNLIKVGEKKRFNSP